MCCLTYRERVRYAACTPFAATLSNGTYAHVRTRKHACADDADTSLLSRAACLYWKCLDLYAQWHICMCVCIWICGARGVEETCVSSRKRKIVCCGQLKFYMCHVLTSTNIRILAGRFDHVLCMPAHRARAYTYIYATCTCVTYLFFPTASPISLTAPHARLRAGRVLICPHPRRIPLPTIRHCACHAPHRTSLQQSSLLLPHAVSRASAK